MIELLVPIFVSIETNRRCYFRRDLKFFSLKLSKLKFSLPRYAFTSGDKAAVSQLISTETMDSNDYSTASQKYSTRCHQA